MYLFNSLHSSLWLFCTRHIVVDGLVGTSRLLRKYLLLCYTLLPVFATSLLLRLKMAPGSSSSTQSQWASIPLATASPDTYRQLLLSLSLYIAPYLPLVQHGPNRSTLNYLRLERCQFCTILHLHVQTSAVHPTLSASVLIAKCWDEFVM